MSTRRRSVLGPINEANKIENRQPLKRSARRASMAVTTYNTEKKTARKSINVKSVKPNISTAPTPINITKSIKMKKSLKESGISQKDIHTKVSQPKSILKASIQLNKENDETSFVSGENFDFNKPISTPYLQSPVAGPMTRSRTNRLRKSIYRKIGPTKRNQTKDSAVSEKMKKQLPCRVSFLEAKKELDELSLQCNENSDESKYKNEIEIIDLTESTEYTKNDVLIYQNDKYQIQTLEPLVLISPLKSKMECSRYSKESTEYIPISEDDMKLNIKIEPGSENDSMVSSIIEEVLEESITCVAELETKKLTEMLKDASKLVTTKIKESTNLDSFDSLRCYTEILSTKTNVDENAEHFEAVLKQLDEKQSGNFVKNIAENSESQQPIKIEIMDGTPNECFEKIEERPSRSKAGSFVTATPFPSRNKRRMLDESLSVTSTTSKTILEVDKSISKESQPKRNSTQASLATPKSLHVNAKRHKIENTLKEQLEENEIEQDDDLKKSNQDSADLESQSPSQFPQSHWYTGDLVRACIIM